MIASQNKGKIREIKSVLNGFPIDFFSINDYKDVPEIIEDGQSFFENAFKKARVISEFTGEIALADDSGLEVDCLGGAPGIFSSRYSGEDATDEKNNLKLLNKLASVPPEERTASFRCVLVLYRPDATFESFEGVWRGRINDEPLGSGGFGYDPVFFLPDYGLTVAQLPDDIKNTISHRAQALNKLKKSLQSVKVPDPGH